MKQAQVKVYANARSRFCFLFKKTGLKRIGLNENNKIISNSAFKWTNLATGE